MREERWWFQILVYFCCCCLQDVCYFDWDLLKDAERKRVLEGHSVVDV